MAHITFDRVRETSTTIGTGAFTLSGVVVGFRTFASVSAVSDTFYYTIAHYTLSEWEVGIGTYSAVNTLTRTTVLASSNAGAAVNFSAGDKDVFISAPASRFLQINDLGSVGNFTAGTITGTLTGNADTVTNGVYTTRSISTTSPLAGGGDLSTNRTLSLSANYGDTINPYASKTANFILAAPNGAAGVPTFRAIVAADIPTLNQNTTGTSSNVTGIVASANGGTGINNGGRTLTIATNSGTIGFTNVTTTLTVANTASISGTNTGDQTTITGNAATATNLATARNINGVSFNGSADITVTAAAGTLSGATLAAGVTASSLTSVGTLGSLAVTGAITGSSFNSITGLASVAPLIAGTATIGISTLTARQDHVHPVQTTVSGTAGSISGFNNPTEAATASTIVYRDSAADISCRLLRPNYTNESTISGAIAYRVNNSTDNYVRFCSDAAAIRTFLGTAATAQTMFVGTTSLTINRASAAQTLTGVSIDGNSATTSQTTFTYPSGGGGTTFAANHYSMGKDIANGLWSAPNYADLIIGYHTGIRIGAAYTGIRFYNNSPTTDANNDGNGDGGEALLMTVGGVAAGTGVLVNNTLTAAGDMRSPIYYDTDNTAYYINAASTSNLNGLILSGASYFRPNTWIQLDGSYGLYWPNHYGAHLHANDLSTYTQIATRGQKNSYGGIYDQYSAINIGMYDSAGNGGVYREANGRWIFYHLIANDCTGFGTSTTSSAYNIYCPKGVYSGGRVDGTIFYDANNTAFYCDPASTSVLNAVQISAGSGTFTGATYFLANQNTATGSAPPLQAYSSSGGAMMSFHRAGVYAVNLGLDSDNVLRVGGWSAAANRLQLDMSGNLTAAGNVTAFSDIRLKKDITKIEDALLKVNSISGYTYTRTDTGERQTGLIAQEVETVLPEVVMTDASGTLHLAYGNMVGLLVEAIKEQQTQIEELKNMVKILMNKY